MGYADSLHRFDLLISIIGGIGLLLQGGCTWIEVLACCTYNSSSMKALQYL